ncbi:hypothetical protein, partial [Methanosarcina acetivorans]
MLKLLERMKILEKPGKPGAWFRNKNRIRIIYFFLNINVEKLSGKLILFSKNEIMEFSINAKIA